MVYYTFSKRKNSLFESLSVNTWLIVINVIAFILFSILIATKILSLEHIALNPLNILDGKYLWTFLTSMFMHGGFFHLFVNMFSLFFVGSLLQKIIGERRYLWFYLISGLFAGVVFIVSALFLPESINSFAVGASGAVFGVVGALILLTPNLPVYAMFIPIPIKLKYAGPGLLILLWLISATAGAPIGNFAHLGGLIAGLVYGFYLTQKYRKKTRMIRRRFS
jgi:uncharacterized protein